MKLTDLQKQIIPLPWRFCHDPEGIIIEPHSYGQVAYIAVLDRRGIVSDDLRLAHARYLVHAANALPKLVAALDLMVEQSACYMDDGEASEEEMRAMDAARSALAIAETIPSSV